MFGADLNFSEEQGTSGPETQCGSKVQDPKPLTVFMSNPRAEPHDSDLAWEQGILNFPKVFENLLFFKRSLAFQKFTIDPDPCLRQTPHTI